MAKLLLRPEQTQCPERSALCHFSMSCLPLILGQQEALGAGTLRRQSSVLVIPCAIVAMPEKPQAVEEITLQGDYSASLLIVRD